MGIGAEAISQVIRCWSRILHKQSNLSASCCENLMRVLMSYNNILSFSRKWSVIRTKRHRTWCLVLEHWNRNSGSLHLNSVIPRGNCSQMEFYPQLYLFLQTPSALIKGALVVQCSGHVPDLTRKKLQTLVSDDEAQSVIDLKKVPNSVEKPLRGCSSQTDGRIADSAAAWNNKRQQHIWKGLRDSEWTGNSCHCSGVRRCDCEQQFYFQATPLSLSIHAAESNTMSVFQERFSQQIWSVAATFFSS